MNGNTKDTNDTEKRNVAAPENKYGFPMFLLNFGFKVNGVPLPYFPVKKDPVSQIESIVALPMRESDVFVAAYMKCGTHWMSEILHMLLNGSTRYSQYVKEHFMLELCDDLPSLTDMPDPRVLNSHQHMVNTPREIVIKKIKIIHLLRNPKDTAVSLYHHATAMGPEPHFNFDNFLNGYMQGDQIAVSHQFNFLRQMSEFEAAHPDHPIMHVHFEDLKSNPASVVTDLANFLGVSASESFCQQVAEACEFDKMKKVDESRILPQNIQGKISPSVFYRKGITGDWKNHFTPAQSERFDDFVRSQQQIGIPYTLREC